jgi:hypothetical protein
MVVWYLVRAWLIESPDASERVIATKPQHSYSWEMWTVTKHDGSTTQIPQRVHRKYYQHSFTAYYDKEYVEGDEDTLPTFAVLRMDGPSALDADDYVTVLDTEAKWNQVFATYPHIAEQFPDGIPT